MSDIQDDIENQAEGAKDRSADQHLGDAMDDPERNAAKTTGDDELEAEGKRMRTEVDVVRQEKADSQEGEGLVTGAGPTQSGGERAPGSLDDVNLEPPSS